MGPVQVNTSMEFDFECHRSSELMSNTEISSLTCLNFRKQIEIGSYKNDFLAEKEMIGHVMDVIQSVSMAWIALGQKDNSVSKIFFSGVIESRVQREQKTFVTAHLKGIPESKIC